MQNTNIIAFVESFNCDIRAKRKQLLYIFGVIRLWVAHKNKGPSAEAYIYIC